MYKRALKINKNYLQIIVIIAQKTPKLIKFIIIIFFKEHPLSIIMIIYFMVFET